MNTAILLVGDWRNVYCVYHSTDEYHRSVLVSYHVYEGVLVTNLEHPKDEKTRIQPRIKLALEL